MRTQAQRNINYLTNSHYRVCKWYSVLRHKPCPIVFKGSAQKHCSSHIYSVQTISISLTSRRFVREEVRPRLLLVVISSHWDRLASKSLHSRTSRSESHLKLLKRLNLIIPGYHCGVTFFGCWGFQHIEYAGKWICL